VGVDNMAWDVIGVEDPNLGVTLPRHLILLARNGIYIIENLQLEELAAAGQHRFTFFCAPLKFVAATGCPVRPLASCPAILDRRGAFVNGPICGEHRRASGVTQER
jgi:kynurenine formamidase